MCEKGYKILGVCPVYQSVFVRLYKNQSLKKNLRQGCLRIEVGQKIELYASDVFYCLVFFYVARFGFICLHYFKLTNLFL